MAAAAAAAAIVEPDAGTAPRAAHKLAHAMAVRAMSAVHWSMERRSTAMMTTLLEAAVPVLRQHWACWAVNPRVVRQPEVEGSSRHLLHISSCLWDDQAFYLHDPVPAFCNRKSSF